MSDTPRTDDQECDMFVGVSTFTSSDIQQAFDFARQLERELNAANKRIDMLTACNADVARIAKERDDTLKRIKRLEEAGNAMFIRSTRVGREIWTKAKEAKP